MLTPSRKVTKLASVRFGKTVTEPSGFDNQGIRNSDWYVTLGGDGFDPVVDPENPDIIYSQLQHGVLSRFDRGSKEWLDIQPQARFPVLGIGSVALEALRCQQREHISIEIRRVGRDSGRRGDRGSPMSVCHIPLE